MSTSKDQIVLVGREDPELVAALSRFGYEVKGVHSSSPLPTFFEKEIVDLVILTELDSFPPEQLLSYLRGYERTRKVPVIVLGPQKNIPELSSADFSPLETVERPYSLGKLVSRVATQLRLRKLAGGEIDASLGEILAAQRDLTQKMKSEIEEARTIQRNLLPKSLPSDSRFDVAAVYEPVEEVGGDWYQVTRESSGKITAQIADVTGHGLPAAFIGSMTKLAFHAASIEAPGARLEQMNRLLSPLVPEGRFVTLATLLYDPATGGVRLARAGHPPALVLKRGEGTVVQMAPKGFALGFFDEGVFEEQELSLEAGDVILLYTDGFTEAQNRNFEQYGTERLSSALLRAKDEMTAEGIVRVILDDFYSFIDGRRVNDDLTLIALHRSA